MGLRPTGYRRHKMNEPHSMNNGSSFAGNLEIIGEIEALPFIETVKIFGLTNSCGRGRSTARSSNDRCNILFCSNGRAQTVASVIPHMST